MCHEFSFKQLHSIVAKPLDQASIDTFYMLGVMFEYNFDREHLSKAKEALSILIRRKVPAIDKAIPNSTKSKEVIQIEFTANDKELFWDIYNDRIR